MRGRSLNPEVRRWGGRRLFVALVRVEDQDAMAVLGSDVVADLSGIRVHVSRWILAAGDVGTDRRPWHRAPPFRFWGKIEGGRQSAIGCDGIAGRYLRRGPVRWLR